MKISDLGEIELISKIRERFLSSNLGVVLGIGDDAAIVRFQNRNIILTKDILVEDVHFKFSFHPSNYLGRKCLAVNLSDIAAVGGEPKFVLLGLALPSKVTSNWINEFFTGFKTVCRKYRVALVGGDISSSLSKIFISVSLLGEGERIIRRKGAKPGDLIFVSGYLGEASYGLSLLKKGIRLGQDRKKDSYLKAFLNPIAQIELGQELSQKQIASSMIDISDGLSTDLFHICQESGVGARIYQDKIPFSKKFLSESIRVVERYDLALHGGEDYQLLFTVSPTKMKEVANLKKKVNFIGYITDRKNQLTIVNQKGEEIPLKVKGYEHFKK
ncbi:MAG: thiamine-phosphate kinase [Candidatus Aminicenantia bacterium]